MTDLQLPIVVPLTRPIELDGETIDKLSFDEPDLDAQLAFVEFQEKLKDPDNPTALESMQATRLWVAHLAGISEAAAGKIKASDSDAVNDVVSKILGFVEGEDRGNGVGA